jgi:hypothetical protein
MITVSAGTDTYGRVKNVSGTPIVTKFAMLQFLPIYPLRSFYFSRSGPTEIEGVPLVAGTRSTTIIGIPLASLDIASVLLAYVRGLFGAFVLVGFVVLLIPGFMYLTGEHAGGLPTNFLRGVLALFLAGALGGLLTYAIPLTTRREKDIRRYCGELLGIAADPARVTSEASAKLAGHVEALSPSGEPSRAALIRELVMTRAKIASSSDIEHIEKRTDELLDQLRHLELRI